MLGVTWSTGQYQECSVTGLYGLLGIRCVAPATFRGIAGCRHEHVETIALCAEHLELARDRQVLCGHCYAVDRHTCMVRTHKIEPIEGSTHGNENDHALDG